MMNAGTTVIGSLSRTMPRAIYLELPWNTGVRILVLKYMTGEIPHSCWTSCVTMTSRTKEYELSHPDTV